jgi:hypothetical protein
MATPSAALRGTGALGADPFSGCLSIFRGRRATAIQVLQDATETDGWQAGLRNIGE